MIYSLKSLRSIKEDIATTSGNQQEDKEQDIATTSGEHNLKVIDDNNENIEDIKRIEDLYKK